MVYFRSICGSLRYTIMYYTLPYPCHTIRTHCAQNKSTEISDVKLKIRKNKAGLVVVEGSVIRPASTAEELYSLFEQGAAARWVWIAYL